MVPTIDARILTSFDGCQIYADAVGNPSKLSLVFIHGLSLSAVVYDNIFSDARYSSEFFLVRYDVRGHGRSGKPDTVEEYSSKHYAEDFAAVLKAFDLHKPVVVAWSLGATVIADITAHLPGDTIAGVVYIAPCPYIGPIMQVIGTPFILELITAMITTEDATKSDDNLQVFFDSCFVDPKAVPWETRALWQGFSTFQRPRHRRFVLSRTQDPTRLYELGAQGLPALALLGSKDPQLIGQSLEKEIKSIFSNVEFCLLDGAGHSLHYEKKEEVMGHIISFTRKLHIKGKPKPNGITRVPKDSGSFCESLRLDVQSPYVFTPALS